MAISQIGGSTVNAVPTLSYPGWRFKNGGFCSLGYYDFGDIDQYSRNIIVTDNSINTVAVVIGGKGWSGQSDNSPYAIVAYDATANASLNSNTQLLKTTSTANLSVYNAWQKFTGDSNMCTLAYANNVWFYGYNTGLYSSTSFGSIGSLRISGNYKARGVAYGNSTYVHVASDDSSLHSLYTSTDGATWTSRTVGNATNARDIVFGNGIFVLARNNTNGIATSTDGLTWTNRTVGARAGVAHNGLTGASSKFVASSSSQGAGTTPFSYSVDGVTWTTANSIGSIGNTINWPSITYGNGYFVAVYSAWDTSSGSSVWNWYVAYSTDGISWSTYTLSGNREATNTGGSCPQGIAYGNGAFVIGGGSYNYRCSGAPTSASSWSAISSSVISPGFTSGTNNSTGNGLRPLIYDGTRFIGIFSSNISYSTDGLVGTPMQIVQFQHGSGQTLN